MTSDRAQVFRALYADHFDAVLGFALRRVERREDAADVTADTFLVAWRRLGDVPRASETRPWLYGVARKVLANHRRGDRRRDHLGLRLRDELRDVVPDPADDVAARADVTAAMDRLSDRDREVLQLHLWEGLEPREIAQVLGLTTVVVRPRLSRARSRLRGELGNDPRSGGHDHSDSNTETRLVRKEQ